MDLGDYALNSMGYFLLRMAHVDNFPDVVCEEMFEFLNKFEESSFQEKKLFYDYLKDELVEGSYLDSIEIFKDNLESVLDYFQVSDKTINGILQCLEDAQRIRDSEFNEYEVEFKITFIVEAENKEEAEFLAHRLLQQDISERNVTIDRASRVNLKNNQ